MTADWYQNATWNETIEQAFEKKLRRTGNKGQYLRIQAATLAQSHPRIALKLLDRYFDLPVGFDHAQALVDRATALLALGSTDEAIASYEAALAREAAFPNVQTHACFELPYLIATRRIRERYHQALRLLQTHEARPTMPVDHFRWHAARALIGAAMGEMAIATLSARKALEAARIEHSGFRHHPSKGLVTAQYANIITRLEALAGA